MTKERIKKSHTNNQTFSSKDGKEMRGLDGMVCRCRIGACALCSERQKNKGLKAEGFFKNKKQKRGLINDVLKGLYFRILMGLRMEMLHSIASLWEEA